MSIEYGCTNCENAHKGEITGLIQRSQFKAGFLIKRRQYLIILNIQLLKKDDRVSPPPTLSCSVGDSDPLQSHRVAASPAVVRVLLDAEQEDLHVVAPGLGVGQAVEDGEGLPELLTKQWLKDTVPSGEGIYLTPVKWPLKIYCDRGH